jgi:trk system potassium uptake protein
MTVSRTICLGFIAVILAGTLLLTLPFATTPHNATFWDDVLVALFTSTSAVCVTGHVVVETATHFTTFGKVVIMLLIQIGGLGYMTATTFLLLLLGRKFNLKDKIAIQQALDRQGMQGSNMVLRSIIATTALFELTGLFIMLLVFVPKLGWGEGIWYSLFHAVSAWNNAGFSLVEGNLMSYQSVPLINLVIPGLIIFGGIGYDVIMEMYLWLRAKFSGQKKSLMLSLNFKIATTTTIFLLLAGAIALYFTDIRTDAIYNNMDLATKLQAAWFQSATTRTAGFNTIDIGKLSNAALFIIIALMFIGGSPGGTAGGIKTTTIRVLTGVTKSILQGKDVVLMYERNVPASLILKAVAVAVGSVAFINTLFEVVSAFGTVGLSTGITAALTAKAKLILVATMYVGRVGVLLLMSALLGDPRPSSIQYPEENLLVG